MGGQRGKMGTPWQIGRSEISGPRVFQRGEMQRGLRKFLSRYGGKVQERLIAKGGKSNGGKNLTMEKNRV